MVSLASCQLISPENNRTPVAKVYNKVLYLEDINKEIYIKKTPEDSLKNINQYIENWVYHTLLIEQAKNNVDTLKINKLVKKYKEDLLTTTYKTLLVEKNIDTLVTEQQIESYYNKYNQFFLADKPMLSPSFLVVPKYEPKLKDYKKWFFSDKNEFKDSLLNNQVSFSKFDFNNKNWIEIDAFKEKFSAFSKISDKQILKKSKKFVLTDSLSLYLVIINDVAKENTPLPLNFVRNDLKKLVLNQRKQKGIDELQKELKKEAIKNKHFKLFKIKKNDK